MKGPMLRFSERFSVKGRAEKCKNEGIRAQNMSDLITVDCGRSWGMSWQL